MRSLSDCVVVSTPWVVTLVCGASGVGKTSVARGLALRYGVPLAPSDDVVTALKAVVTPDQHPLLHYWDTHPEAGGWPAERIVDLHLRVADSLQPAFRAVIADHVDSGLPVIMEGDYMLPDLVEGGAVRGLVVDEDELRISANFQRREPEHGPQPFRARVSGLITAALVARATPRGIPVVGSAPWDSAIDRADAALWGTDDPLVPTG